MIILFISAFLVLNQPSPSAGKPIQEPQQRTANSAQSAQHNENPTQPSTPSGASVLSPKSAPQQQEKAADIPDKKDDKSPPDWVARFTGALVIVAALQLGILFWQILTSRSTARKELQAYVFPISAVRYIENGSPKIKVVLRNSGKTPALECVSEFFEGVGPIQKPLPPLPEIDKTKSTRSISFIASDADMWMLDPAAYVSDAHAEAIRTNRGALYVIGTITYIDVFKTRHTSQYRFMCSGENFDVGTFVFCDEGNSIE
jgi:hypothetical protein